LKWKTSLPAPATAQSVRARAAVKQVVAVVADHKKSALRDEQKIDPPIKA
jgi:hypothetical protein